MNQSQAHTQGTVGQSEAVAGHSTNPNAPSPNADQIHNAPTTDIHGQNPAGPSPTDSMNDLLRNSNPQMPPDDSGMAQQAGVSAHTSVGMLPTPSSVTWSDPMAGLHHPGVRFVTRKLFLPIN